GAETVLPAVLGRALDAVLTGRDAAHWLIACGLLVAVLVACDALDDVAAATSTAQSTRWLRRRLIDHVLTLRPGGARRFDPRDLAARLVGNTADAGRTAAAAVWAATALVPAVGGVVALGLIDPWLCATFLVGAPVLLVLVRIFVRDASALAENYLRVQGQIAG